MVTFVLDASAVIRFLDSEAGAERVEDIFILKRIGSCEVSIPAVNWGEVANKLTSRRGRKYAEELMSQVAAFGLVVVPTDEARAVRAGFLRAQFKIPYADCFGVELASDSPDHILITADFDAKPAAQTIRIEFLPTKPKP